MFYNNLRVFSWISNIFGIGNTQHSSNNKTYLRILSKCWSFMIVIIIIVCYFISYKDNIGLNIQENLEQFSGINDIAVNVFVILISLFDRQNTCIDLYENVNTILNDIKVVDRNCKLIIRKFFIWLGIPSILLIILIILEVSETDPPFVLLSRIPTFLCFVHFTIHMYVLLAVLHFVTGKFSEMLFVNDYIFSHLATNNSLLPKTLEYILDPEIKFFDNDQHNYTDIKFLCKIYDRIVTCIQLLEQFHGMQILLIIWLMFSSAVFGVTLIACNQAKFPWLVIAKSIFPFVWCFIGSYIQGQMQKEVESIEIIIVKYMIDYKSDSTRKSTLQIFKQLVSTSRLQFTACNLFHLNYSMLLNAIMNIITYSIILIQLFLNQ